MGKRAIQTNKESLAQNIRNVFYALTAVAAIFGFVLDQSYLEPIIAGVLAAISLVSSVLAWWYSRRKFVVAAGTGAAEA